VTYAETHGGFKTLKRVLEEATATPLPKASEDYFPDVEDEYGPFDNWSPSNSE
jgi:hypothetical protein